MAEILCRHFNGYKPCGLHNDCSSSCPHSDLPQLRLLIVHLEALGAVLRATSLLPAIKRKFPSSHITWVTQAPAQGFFENLNWVDRVLTTSHDDLLKLRSLEFDIAFCIDKSLKASGVLASTRFDLLYGYQADPRSGAILPSNEEALEYWQLGLDDQRKFFVNKKPETQLICEALALTYSRDEYQIALSRAESEQAIIRSKEWRGDKKWIIGINTGCSDVISSKKLTVEFHRQMIQQLPQDCAVVLLGGGAEDELRNQKISEGLNVIQSDTRKGLRDGLISTHACDLVFSGDSLGMHMAIALKKYVIAWFGPTCAHEIDFFDRGEAILTQATCSPCWKRSCQKDPMCYDLVSPEQLVQAVERGFKWLEGSSLSKQHFSEIYCSQFP